MLKGARMDMNIPAQAGIQESGDNSGRADWMPPEPVLSLPKGETDGMRGSKTMLTDLYPGALFMQSRIYIRERWSLFLCTALVIILVGTAGCSTLLG
jgi:hypothetical protein